MLKCSVNNSCLTTVCFSLPFIYSFPHCPSDWPPVPEQDTAQAEKATHLLHPHPGGGAGKAIPQTEVPGVGGTGCPCARAQNDRCASENLVPKPPHKMEVSERDRLCTCVAIKEARQEKRVNGFS